VSLLEVSKALEIAQNALGSPGAVAERVGVSAKMLGQFARVSKLSPFAKDLVSCRKIDSVDVVSHLAQLDAHEQDVLAESFVLSHLDSSDVRAVVELRNRAPERDIHDLLKSVLAGKTTKEFVFEFIARGDSTAENVRQRLSSHLELNLVKRVDVHPPTGHITVGVEGMKRLKELAQRMKVPLRNIIPEILRSRH
jgi:hypothetical protein